MVRDFQISGEGLVLVKGRSDSGIGTLQQLGLPDREINVSVTYLYQELTADAYGQQVPADAQFMLAWADVDMTLVHVDRTILNICMMESQGGTPLTGNNNVLGTPVSEGTVQRAGVRLGNNLPRFSASTTADANGIVRGGNHLISVNITSPVGNTPYRFPTCYLLGPPLTIPLGTRRSIFTLRWRAIPYTLDPAGAASLTGNPGTVLGAQGNVLWDHVLDT